MQRKTEMEFYIDFQQCQFNLNKSNSHSLNFLRRIEIQVILDFAITPIFVVLSGRLVSANENCKH